MQERQQTNETMKPQTHWQSIHLNSCTQLPPHGALTERSKVTIINTMCDEGSSLLDDNYHHLLPLSWLFPGIFFINGKRLLVYVLT